MRVGALLLTVPDSCLLMRFWRRRRQLVPGLHLGAVGMALKTTGYGLISVQVYDWLNCHFLGIRYAAVLGRRMVALATVGAIAGVVLGVGGPVLRSTGLESVLPSRFRPVPMRWLLRRASGGFLAWQD